MQTATLHARATTFALCAGAVTFFLALLTTVAGGLNRGDLMMMLVPAIVCAALTWASTQRGVADTAAAIDAAVDRLTGAASGDLAAPVPESTVARVPRLAHAMSALFAQLAANFDRVEQLALYDPVTGLANRGSFRASAEAQLAQLARGETAALFFIDLDRFKAVNDNRGHACGDQLLAQVAERLRGVAQTAPGTRPLLGRLAGDEFTVLWPAPGDAAAVQALGDRILATLGAPFDLPGGPVAIGASIGVALRPEHGETLHDLMRAADAAMYQSKAEGRARMSRYSDRLAAEIADREQLDRELRLALERGEFALAFQPQVALHGGSLIAAEALLRWRHPIAGLRTPGQFLARAEENGQMVAIGGWIVAAVADAAARWHREGQAGRVTLNLSHRQVEHRGFFDDLAAAFARAGAPLDRLEIELSERLAMRCAPEAVEALAELRRAGATIAVDDFGTAESSVQRLRMLPVDRVKLDAVLLHDIADDASARSILQALIGLVHGLGCEAVAEGVETQAQIDVLRVLGCDALQGYAIARPMDLGALARWAHQRGGALTPGRALGR